MEYTGVHIAQEIAMGNGPYTKVSITEEIKDNNFDSTWIPFIN